MWTIWYHRLKLPIMAVLVLTYFGFHGYHGNRGYLTRVQLEETVSELEAEHAKIQAEREYWHHRTQLMQSNQLDFDLLDERARYISAGVAPGEVIITDLN